MQPQLHILCHRGRHYVAAGRSRLSKGFKTLGAAVAELEGNRAFYAYWAGSVSVSVENTPARVVRA